MTPAAPTPAPPTGSTPAPPAPAPPDTVRPAPGPAADPPLPSVPSGLRLVGGEMLGWSDLDRRPAGGQALAALMRAVPPGGRVLVAGPHAPYLVAALPGRYGQVSCLLRSYSDGAALARLFDGAAEVVCGSLARLAAEEPYDAVFALDGVERLCSVEGTQLTWSEAMRALGALVRPGGRLLLGVPNGFGVHRLVAVAEAEEATPWVSVEEAAVGRPANPDRLRAALAAADLTPTRVWAAFPVPGSPRVIVSLDVLLSEGARSGQLDGPLAAAFGDAFTGLPVLSDPRRLATGAVRAGLGALLAPLWFVSAVRGRPDAPPTGPEFVISDGYGPLALAYEFGPDGRGEWTRRPVLGASRAGPVAVAGVRRDGRALAGAAASGHSLGALLLEALAVHNVPRLRRLLAQWAAVAGDNPFATADNVVVTADRLVVWDPSWSLSVRVRPEVAMARCLREFAATIVQSGHPHPWPAVSGADALATVLAGLAGHRLDPTLLAEAVALEVVVQTAQRGLDGAEKESLARRLERVDVGTPPSTVEGFREMRVATRTLRRELDDAQAKLAWYESRLTAVETAARIAREESVRGHRRRARQWSRRLVRATLKHLGLLAVIRRSRAGRRRGPW